MKNNTENKANLLLPRDV